MRHILRLGGALALVAAVTAVDYRVFRVNSSTAGFAYLLLILFISSKGDLPAALTASFSSVVCYDFFFLPPDRPILDWRTGGLGGLQCLSDHRGDHQ